MTSFWEPVVCGLEQVRCVEFQRLTSSPGDYKALEPEWSRLGWGWGTHRVRGSTGAGDPTLALSILPSVPAAVSSCLLRLSFGWLFEHLPPQLPPTPANSHSSSETFLQLGIPDQACILAREALNAVFNWYLSQANLCDHFYFDDLRF